MAQNRGRYVTSLDGLRALAVLAVIAYHMKMSWAPGGLLGVTVFFVLSGYLITSLLLKERATSGTISLKGFWVRRIRRIIPAVVFAVLGTAAVCTIFNHALLTKMRPDVVPTLLFVNNWWQIVHEVSYFEALGQPSPLTHFWSLAIEEQFYLVWPIALLGFMKLGVRKKALRRGTLFFAVLSAVEMALLFDPTQDPSRVYYGTDTRAFSLLIGAYLAFIWPYQQLTPNAAKRMAPTAKVILNVVGILAVGGILAMVALTDGYSAFTYRGGLVLCSVLSAIAIAALVHPVSLIEKIFQVKPLTWIGQCSYSMYLWHYPVILLMTPAGLVGDAPWWLRLLQLVVIFAISAFSYYVVENPIRHQAIGKLISGLAQHAFTLGEWLRKRAVALLAALVCAGVAIGGLITVPDTTVATELDMLKEEQAPRLTTSNTNITPYDMLLIGDSVPISLTYYGVFPTLFPYGHNDAVQDRQFPEAINLYKEYRDEGAVGDVVVIALGTNGSVTEAQFEELMHEIGDEKHVWFINNRGPADTYTQNNTVLKNGTDRHQNAQLIDWYTTSAQVAEADIPDGIHPVNDGAWTYGAMINEAISSYLPKHEAGEKTRDQQITEDQERVKENAHEYAQRVDDAIRGLLKLNGSSAA